MTRHVNALALVSIMIMGAATIAHAQGPGRTLTVFVTAAPITDAPIAPTAPRYGNASQEELAGSVEDVRRGLAGAGLPGRREHVVLVDSASDAQLIVEIRGRRSEPSLRLFGRQYFALFVIKPGPKLTTERFAAIPRTYRQDALLAGPTQSGAPEWLWEAAGRGSWKLAGAVASTLVDQFVEAHYDLLTKSVATR